MTNPPYTRFDNSSLQGDPIAFAVIDRGMFPPAAQREAFPVPAPSRIDEPIDPRRVGALIIDTLEKAATEGHTILPVDWVIERVASVPSNPNAR